MEATVVWILLACLCLSIAQLVFADKALSHSFLYFFDKKAVNLSVVVSLFAPAILASICGISQDTRVGN